MSIPVDPRKYGRTSIVDPVALAKHGAETGAYAELEPPRAAILCYHRGLAQALLANRPARKVPGFFGDTYLLDETGGEVALVADFGIGAPVAAVMLEDLVALGCRDVVSIGTCGGMDPTLSVGDVILCDRAIRDEGTSHHYAPAGDPAEADTELTNAVAALLETRSVSYRRAGTWTTDAPYRETAEEVLAHVANDTPVVEMEAAALFVVGAIRGARVASMLVVSDVLSALDGTWIPEFHGEVVNDRLATVFDVALATLTGD